MRTLIQHYDWIVAKSKRRIRNENMTTRPRVWMRVNRLYRLWRPAFKKALITQRQKQNPEWGTW